jgi:sulfonate transport system permease protein
MTTRYRVISLGLPRRRRRAGEQPRLRAARLGWRTAPWFLPLGILLLWGIATEHAWLPAQLLPAPAVVLASFIDLIRSGDIADNLAVSLQRILAGFALGAGLGLALGVALGRSPRLDAYLSPTLRGIAQVPSLGWLPFLILIFGLGEALNIVIIAKAAFIPVVLNTAAGIRNIPAPYLELARVLRLGRVTTIARVVLPAALPTIFSGLRLGLSHAWIAMVVVEMLADTAGIGYMMTWGRTLFQIDIVLLGMAMIGAIGFLMDSGLSRIERRLRRWAPAYV